MRTFDIFPVPVCGTRAAITTTSLTDRVDASFWREGYDATVACAVLDQQLRQVAEDGFIEFGHGQHDGVICGAQTHAVFWALRDLHGCAMAVDHFGCSMPCVENMQAYIMAED